MGEQRREDPAQHVRDDVGLCFIGWPRTPAKRTRREASGRESVQLRWGIGLVGLTAYGIGTILAAGIYALIGQAAAMAGEGLWLSFLLAAVVATLTGLSYAELASTFPKAGAEFEFVHRAFGSDRLAFLVGWILALSGVASASTVALGFAGYLHGLVGLPISLTSLLVLLFASAISIVGIRESTAVNVAFTLIEAGGLVAVIVVASHARGILVPPLPVKN